MRCALDMHPHRQCPPVNAVREAGAPLPARRQIVPQSGGLARVEVPFYLLVAPRVWSGP